MGWGRSNAVRQPAVVVDTSFTAPAVKPATVDWERLVTVDFETYYDEEYTLRKLSTSEYIRDPRFKAQMVGIKIGSKATKWYPAAKVKTALAAIPWATHSFLGHHAQFDGLILWEHFGISPLKIYDTLSMARALYSNDIGAGLDEVSLYTGGPGKIHDVLETTRGVLVWSKALNDKVGPYCCRDVDETLRIFKHMLPRFPAEEIELIDHICRMFTEPVLGVDRPRVEKELEREIEEKRNALLFFKKDADKAGIKLSKSELLVLADKDGNVLQDDADVKRVKKLIGSQKFADLLRACGVEPPVKVSPAWMKTPKEERDDTKKWVYAFSKTDLKFVELQEHDDPRVRELVAARLMVKSTTNETRAGRFLKASEKGALLPVYLKYSAAHTHRLGGGNKMNMQNLKRGGELRASILAPKNDLLHILDSGQIEARVNGWLWGQEDLLADFRLADRGLDRDVYCKFADLLYGREITTADKIQRFVGKTCILGLGYQMGAERLRKTLALGTQGPQVFISEEESFKYVMAYRKKNFRIKNGWNICQRIIEQMATGTPGSYKCISWDKETLYLPNGMSMHYPNLHDSRIEKLVAAKLTDDHDLDFDPDRPQFVYDSKDNEKKIYGGLLCENIVQALARIIVMNQCLAVMRSGKFKRWVMSTHDEGVFLAKKANPEKLFKLALTEFSTPPAWALDLPLNADGGFDTYYSK